VLEILDKEPDKKEDTLLDGELTLDILCQFKPRFIAPIDDPSLLQPRTDDTSMCDIEIPATLEDIDNATLGRLLTTSPPSTSAIRRAQELKLTDWEEVYRQKHLLIPQ